MYLRDCSLRGNWMGYVHGIVQTNQQFIDFDTINSQELCSELHCIVRMVCHGE